MVKVVLYCEGPTEWYVMYQLVKRGVLPGTLVGSNQRVDIGTWLKKVEEINETFIIRLPEDHRNILLVFDQEQRSSPGEVNEILGLDLSNDSNDGLKNIFTGVAGDRKIALVVSNKPSPDGNRDFDGYLWELIQQLDAESIRLFFDNEMPGYLRNFREESRVGFDVIHNLGRRIIPEEMCNQQWPLQRSKGLLYAYITALQLGKSHVWFAEKLVKHAPEQVLKNVFNPFIKAWAFLTAEGDTNEE